MVLSSVSVSHAVLRFDFVYHPIIEFIEEYGSGHKFNTGCYTVFKSSSEVSGLPSEINGVMLISASAVFMETA
jgi:hypothetical protein